MTTEFNLSERIFDKGECAVDGKGEWWVDECSTHQRPKFECDNIKRIQEEVKEFIRLEDELLEELRLEKISWYEYLDRKRKLAGEKLI